jgi:hypothetical protein
MTKQQAFAALEIAESRLTKIVAQIAATPAKHGMERKALYFARKKADAAVYDARFNLSRAA